MATKQRADRQKEKEKKEKILLAVLVLILIVVGAVMLPGMLKGNAGATASTTPQTTGTSSSATSSGTPSASGVPASGTPGAATFPNVSTTYQPGDGQLSGFGRFASNDPFANAPGQTGANSTNATNSTASRSTSISPTRFSGGNYAAAVISINGTPQAVALHSGFPSASQVFTLDSVSAKSIKVSVAGGSFAGGRSSITIRKGHTVVLENTVDGTRYALKMIYALVSSGGTSAGTTSSTSKSAGTTTSTSAGTTTSTGT